MRPDPRLLVEKSRRWLYRTWDIKLALEAAAADSTALDLAPLREAQGQARAALVQALAEAGLDTSLAQLASTLRGALAGHEELVLLGPGPLARYVGAAAGEELPGLRVVRVGSWRRGLEVTTPLGPQGYDAVDILEVVLEDELGYRVRMGAWQGGLPLVPIEVHGTTLFRRRDTVVRRAEEMFFARTAELRSAQARLDALLAGPPGEDVDAALLVTAKDVLRWRRYGPLWEGWRDLSDAARRGAFADAYLAAEEERAAARLLFVREGTADLVAAEAVALLAAVAGDFPLDALAVACGLRGQVLAAPPGATLPPVAEAAAAALIQLAEALGARSLPDLVDARPEDLRAAAARILRGE